jgi:hypothetical protein
LGLLLASFSISAQVISTDTLANDTTKVIKKTILNKTTAALANGSNEDKRFLPNFSPLSQLCEGYCLRRCVRRVVPAENE